MEEDEPLFLAVLADVADAMASEGVAKVANAGAASSHEHVAAGHLELADDRLGQLGAPGADQAVQAEDLSPVEAEGDAARPRLGGEVSHLEHRLAACGTGGQLREHVRPSDHVGDHLVLGEAFDLVVERGVAAVPQDGHPIRQLEHLLELVTDEDHGDALGAQLSQDAEQVAGLVRGDRRRRLVQEEDPRLQGEGLGDLDQLHLGRAEGGDRPGRRHVESHRLHPGSRVSVNGCVIDELWKPGRYPLEQDVLCHGELRDQVVLLVDDADPRLQRVARGPKTNGRPVDRDAAGVRLVNAGEDLDQRALAGAVLADQGLDLSAAQAERDVVQRHDSRKLLANAGRLEDHARRRHGAHFCSAGRRGTGSSAGRSVTGGAVDLSLNTSRTPTARTRPSKTPPRISAPTKNWTQ